jgi:hypothetical protein
MNLLRNGLLMRKTGDLQRTKLTEESASQCGFSAEFITPSHAAKTTLEETFGYLSDSLSRARLYPLSEEERVGYDHRQSATER